MRQINSNKSRVSILNVQILLKKSGSPAQRKKAILLQGYVHVLRNAKVVARVRTISVLRVFTNALRRGRRESEILIFGVA